MAHHMRRPAQADEVTQIRLTSGGCPYACDATGEVVRLACVEEGHPDDSLPFGVDLMPEEEALLPDLPE